MAPPDNLLLWSGLVVMSSAGGTVETDDEADVSEWEVVGWTGDWVSEDPWPAEEANEEVPVVLADDKEPVPEGEARTLVNWTDNVADEGLSVTVEEGVSEEVLIVPPVTRTVVDWTDGVADEGLSVIIEEGVSEEVLIVPPVARTVVDWTDSGVVDEELLTSEEDDSEGALDVPLVPTWPDDDWTVSRLVSNRVLSWAVVDETDGVLETVGLWLAEETSDEGVLVVMLVFEEDVPARGRHRKKRRITNRTICTSPE